MAEGGAPGGEAAGPVLVVTRPQAQAQRWIDALAARGIPARSLPLIEIAPVDDDTALRGEWGRLGCYALVMFVSANAVAGFFDASGGAAWPEGLHAGSTGPGTSAALAARGVPQPSIDAPPADAASLDSEALWAVIRARDWVGARVLIVRGDGGRDWLAQTLAAHGAEVSFVQAYARRAPRPDPAGLALLAALAAAPERHILWFSSSEAVARLVELCPAAPMPRLVAWASHPRIAERARAAGIGRVEVVGPSADAAAEAWARECRAR